MPPAGAAESAPPSAYEIYNRWARREGVAVSGSVRKAIEEAWASGAHTEALCRREGRAAAALEVAEFVDGLGLHSKRAGEDHAYFAGLAAEVYFAGTPLRRRLRLAWRLLRPRWVEELAWRRAQRKRQR